MPKDEKSKFDPQKFLDEYEDNLSPSIGGKREPQSATPRSTLRRRHQPTRVPPLSKRELPVADEEADEETNRL